MAALRSQNAKYQRHINSAGMLALREEIVSLRQQLISAGLPVQSAALRRELSVQEANNESTSDLSFLYFWDFLNSPKLFLGVFVRRGPGRLKRMCEKWVK